MADRGAPVGSPWPELASSPPSTRPSFDAIQRARDTAPASRTERDAPEHQSDGEHPIAVRRLSSLATAGRRPDVEPWRTGPPTPFGPSGLSPATPCGPSWPLA